MRVSVSYVMPAVQPQHHISDELLFDYAAGTSDEAQSLLVASHLSYCQTCRRRLAELETLGGALMADIEVAPEPENSLSFDALLSRIDDMYLQTPVESEPPPAQTSAPAWVPGPLKPYVADDLSGAWRSVTRGIDEVPLETSGRLSRAKLLRIRAGTKVPQHTHAGSEHTLVMQGSFIDGDETFLAGDVAIGDSDLDHCPAAGPEGDCICLVVLDAPLRLTGPVGRFLNPFVKL